MTTRRSNRGDEILLKITGIAIFLVLMLVTIHSKDNKHNNMISDNKTELATFAGGCFWCTEAVFERVKGVDKVISGYSGGDVINPSYREVTTGSTGHAEAIQIEYDPSVITYTELLEIFFKTHDPTTLNRQGADVGTQYRSAVFYHDEKQEETARSIIDLLNKEQIWDDPIVTEVTKFKNFFIAEEYHQEYYDNNKNQGYCRMVITPKIKKFNKLFKDKLK
ncbi:MAG TPA: peptide-methionine (S)-S-oxide reductase MsrA [Bacteroidales bacterium]|nr:peptide-methionine (S)-S-oxide reductase MsrA [Bacteroidales bacterium]